MSGIYFVYRALSLKDPEADRLAREIADRTGETLAGAIVVALRERLARLRTRTRRRLLSEELREIGERCAARPTLDERTEDEILGYDDNGLPTLMVVDGSALLAILLNEPDAAPDPDGVR